MMKFVVPFLACIFSFSTGFSQEFPAQPDPPRLVVDFAGMLPDQSRQSLEQKLRKYHDTTSNQLSVVILKSVGSYDIGQYAIELAEKWGIGQQGKDNGILILIAAEDRKMFIATGYGMEGFVPDALAKRIVESTLKPAFRQGDFYVGLEEATDQIIGLTSGAYTSEDIPGGQDIPMANILFFGFFILIFFILIPLFKYRSIKNSHYGRDLDFLTTMVLISGMSGRGSSYGNFSSGSGSFSGGSSFGGFGGGSFGGGGAGGSW